jgi:hypothetical protein
VTTKLAETGILCPECEIPLIYLPKPIGDDIVVCPECGAGGDHDEVVGKGASLTKSKMPLDQLRDLLKRHGFGVD